MSLRIRPGDLVRVILDHPDNENIITLVNVSEADKVKKADATTECRDDTVGLKAPSGLPRPGYPNYCSKCGEYLGGTFNGALNHQICRPKDQYRDAPNNAVQGEAAHKAVVQGFSDSVVFSFKSKELEIERLKKDNEHLRLEIKAFEQEKTNLAARSHSCSCYTHIDAAQKANDELAKDTNGLKAEIIRLREKLRDTHKNRRSCLCTDISLCAYHRGLAFEENQKEIKTLGEELRKTKKEFTSERECNLRLHTRVNDLQRRYTLLETEAKKREEVMLVERVNAHQIGTENNELKAFLTEVSNRIKEKL